MDAKESFVASITLHRPIDEEECDASEQCLLVNLEVEESRKGLILEYEKRLEVVDMLEEIVEWLQEIVWVSLLVK